MTRPVCRPSLASLVLGTSISAVAGCTSQDLGHGYRLVHVTVINPPGAFEALAHYDDLYYGLRKLGRVGECDISPSGRYAAFEDDGTLRLFDKRSGRIHDITDGEFAIPSRFDWDESAGVLRINYYERHAPSRVALPGNPREVTVQEGRRGQGGG
jgi:hypothetical protein